MSCSEELLQMKQAQQSAARDTVDGVGVSMGRRKGVTLSEGHTSSEGARLSIVHTDADRGPSSAATTTLVPIASPPSRPRSRRGSDRGECGPPWTRGAGCHSGPCRPSQHIPRQTMEELKTTLRDGPQLAFRGQGDKRTGDPGTTHLKGQNQGGEHGRDADPSRVFTTFKPHADRVSRRGLDPADSRAGRNPSSPFRQDASRYRNPGGVPGQDPSQEDECSQTDSREPGTEGPWAFSPDMENITQQMTRQNVSFVRFEAVDLHGVARSKTIPARHFHEKAAHGVPMARSSLELTLSPGSSQVDNAEGPDYSGDILLMPDLRTFRVLPWTERTARVICDPCSVAGAPLPTSPRLVAKRLLGQLQSLGLSLRASFTYECCVLGGDPDRDQPRPPVIPGANPYPNTPFFQQLVDGLYCMGADVDSFGASAGHAQVEVRLRPQFGIAAADSAFTFRTGVRELARKHGRLTSFYAEDSPPRSTGVLSHSLWDAGGRRGLFHAAEASGGELSEMGRKWLAGLLSHASALSCLLAPGCRGWSQGAGRGGVHATYGYNDRGSSFDVQRRHSGRELHIDARLGSAAANPYVVLAATVAAGLDGIRRNLSLEAGPGRRQQQHALPETLGDALEALAEDRLLGSTLGEPFVQYFIAMKKFEMETQQLDDERNKSLEYFI